MQTLQLGARPLTLEDIKDVARNGRQVELSKTAKKKIILARQFLLKEIKAGKTLYGVNTGFGSLSDVKIPDTHIEDLQIRLLRSHACGVGPDLPDAEVRAMLLLRANALALGHSGVSLELVELILELLNRGVCPRVPEQGSVGASGDLAPLSHLALVLIGEGKATVHGKGKEMTGKKALQTVKLKPIKLGPKEGLALINGTQFMTAIGALSLLDAENLCALADAAGAMTVEALRGTSTAYEPEIHAVRPHPGQIAVARKMRNILRQNDRKSEIAKSHENCKKIQDPYSLRCIPQVHGASVDAITFVRQVLEREVNSVTDNPLIFPREGKIYNGGNFHGQAVAIAMDLLAIAVAELASISEQRLEKLINPLLSGLPPFLTEKNGLNSGFMIIQVAAASIVSENKTLCHPASVDSIPTSADQEDHVSMGAWAARKAAKVIKNSRHVLVMELLAAAQGIDLLRPLRSSPAVEKLHQRIRQKVSKLEDDRSLHDEIVLMVQFSENEEFLASIQQTGKAV